MQSSGKCGTKCVFKIQNIGAYYNIPIHIILSNIVNELREEFNS